MSLRERIVTKRLAGIAGAATLDQGQKPESTSGDAGT
jgi:hypothetical protein